MTENEAIERLKCMRLFMEINDKQNESKFLEDDYIANKTAIKALEEIQQYRTIGTVEEIKTAMKYVSLAKKHGTVGKAIDSCAEYEAIGTIDEFKQAMNFKKYFMELYGEGLEVANWHKNGDLEPLVNFIDEACN